MHVSRSVFDVKSTVRKLSSRLRPPPKIYRPEWPVMAAARPLFYLLRFFGLVPFTISDQRNFVSSKYGQFYSLLCAIVHTYVIYTIIYKFTVIERKTAVLDIVETAKVIINYFIVIFNLVVAVWKQREFVGVLNTLKNFDLRLRELGHPLKKRAVKLWVWSICFLNALLWIAVNYTGMAAFAESWITNVAYIVNYLATLLSIVKFSGVVLLLGQRFQHLNEVALRSKKSTLMAKQNYVTVDFKVIQQLHNILMTAGESLDCQYSSSLFVWLINLCLHSVSFLYFLCDWVIVTPLWSSARWPLVHCILWWLLTYVMQLFLLHVSCHYASNEANNLGSIIINWKSLSSVRNYRMESSLHLINRRLNFTAAGCFCINLPLLSSIASILTTYLVLMIQFQS